MTTEGVSEWRRKNCVMYNEQPLKLGLFGINVGNGCTVSHAETTFEPSWEHNLEIAKRAERMDFEMLVAVGRWRGFGGTTDFNGENLEVFTWGAALAAHTEKIMLFPTSHVPTIHPCLAAKQGATIDHISKGRFGLNVVCGWFTPEMEMFGAKQLEHDERYVRATEWLHVIKRMWKEQDFNHEGKYFKVNQGYCLPKPIHDPFPVLVNAGASPAGRKFSAEHCDFNFITLNSLEFAKDMVQEVGTLAAEYKRLCGVMSFGQVICRDTEKEAHDAMAEILEKGDYETATTILNIFGVESGTAPEGFADQQKRLINGWFGYPLIGTPEQVVEQFLEIKKTGLEGMCLSFLDYNEELKYFDDRVMPLMKQAGLRI